MLVDEILKGIDTLIEDIEPMNQHQAKILVKVRRSKSLIKTVAKLAEMQENKKKRKIKDENFRKSNDYELKKARILRAYGL